MTPSFGSGLLRSVSKGSSNKRPWRPSTLAVHGGEPQIRTGRSISAPVVYSSTYPFADTRELIEFMEGRLDRPHEYGRYGNPTVSAAESKISALEGGNSAILVASGMAAITTSLLAILRQGQHVVFTADVYRKTRVFAAQMLAKFGIECSVVPPKVADIGAALRPETKVIFTEAPTNPYLRVIDIEPLVALAGAHRIKTIIDATFATPINMRPLEWGIDLVIHSTTKYLGGHNDILGGAIVGRSALVDAIRENIGTLGPIVDPHNAFLLMRGLKTLALRMERHNSSAQRLAEVLVRHRQIENVWYPGLTSHPDHAIAHRYMRGFGGVISFEVRGGLAAGSALVDALEIPKLAPSLGGVESLIEQPALMSFFELTPEQRHEIGIREGLVRLSVGIEDVEDLEADLLQALDRL